MSFCSKCGNPLEENSKFCAKCGTPVQDAAPAAPAYTAPAAPVYTAPAAPTYTAPVAAEPVVSPKAKVLGFVGMGVSIFGLFMAAIGLLYTFVGMATEETGMGFAFSFAFALFSLPCAIVGRMLCNNSIGMGNNATPCTVGSKLGIAGIIVTAAMLFFGFITLFF